MQHATVRQLLEAMFSELSVPGLYNEGQQPLTGTPQTSEELEAGV